MSVLATTPVPSGVDRTAPSLSRRIAERRRLAREDRIPAQLAELSAARALFADAVRVVEAGWIQDGWFAYRDEQDHERLVGPHNLHEITGRQLTGACLVGAIVHAGGGLPAARTHPVHRALDLTWQALFRVAQPVGYCPAPALRTARVRDLTRWNDRPSRTPGEVTALLGAADEMAAGQVDQVRHLVEAV
ncbi:DUF6197 family protein [Jatrophihabitans sp.]|jgi:hypothetical protein|uniref:DUF6197 family protein n=1 Tax=Jatrophihabitans sp. TaxID=1932789 RepID=UPI002EFC41DB